MLLSTVQSVANIVAPKMFDKISRDVKMDALIMTAKGVKPQQVAQALGISESTIYRSKAKMTKYGDIEAGQQKPGPKNLLSSRIQDVFSSNLFCAS
jgi:transposase